MAILFESTGQIVFRYLNVDSGDANAFGGLAVIGIRNTGGDQACVIGMDLHGYLTTKLVTCPGHTVSSCFASIRLLTVAVSPNRHA